MALEMLVESLDQLFGRLAAVDPKQRVDLCLHPVVILLRGGRADVEEISEADDLPEQLEEFRLPVLERVSAHLGEIGGQFRLLAMGRRLLDEGIPAEQPVKAERNQEKAEGKPAISVASHDIPPVVRRS